MGKSLAFAVVRRALLSLAPLPLFAQQPRSSSPTLPSGTWFIAQPVGADTSVFRFTLRFDRDSVIGANTDGVLRRLHERRTFSSFNPKTSPVRFQAPFRRRSTSLPATRCAHGCWTTRDAIPQARCVGAPAIRSPVRSTSTEHFLAT